MIVWIQGCVVLCCVADDAERNEVIERRVVQVQQVLRTQHAHTQPQTYNTAQQADQRYPVESASMHALCELARDELQCCLRAAPPRVAASRTALGTACRTADTVAAARNPPS